MRPPLRLLALAALASAPAFAAEKAADSPAAPKEYRRASLAERPPFAKAERGPAKPSAGGPLELRGFYGSGKNLEVSLSRADGKEAAWVRVGDKTAKWPVDAADADAGTAEVHFDGMLLHLKLARPEEPTITVTPPAEKTAEAERSRDRRPGMNLSAAGREAMRAAMHESFERARKEHPEYFDHSVQLTEEQQKARQEYMRANMAKVREAVAKASPEDAAQLENMPMPGGRARREGDDRASSGATETPAAGDKGGERPANP